LGKAPQRCLTANISRILSQSQYANLGNVYGEQGDLDEAIRMHEKALVIMQRIGNEPGMGRQYGNLANRYYQKGNTARALEYYRKSLDILERVGDHHSAAAAYCNLAILYRDDIGDLGQARAHFEKAKALFEMVGDAGKTHNAARALREL
jgi:tetratricopeptide (TPR) repeat protein